ncbi:hypothetical protein DENSPDRAFT_277376 [Dentipellis sp. KUC8613]|nr:hypothetical protein DENSPDRAFT_277376 [Dentipellis sp. KUC8613]
MDLSSANNRTVVADTVRGGTLAPFPVEIILHILTNLSYRDLFRCARVCKFLHDVVNRAVQLLYTAELQAEGFVDFADVHGNIPVRDRLKMVIRHAQAWRTLSWKTQASVGLRKSGSLQIVNGTLVCQTLDFIDRIPHKKNYLFQLSLDTLDEKLFEDDYDDELFDTYQSFDVGQDLLVLGNVGFRRDNAGNFVQPVVARHRLRLRTLSSNGSSQHPDASHEALLLSFDAPSPGTVSSLVRIAGTLVGVIVQHATQGFCIALWNWRTGHMLVDLENPLNRMPLCDFCFLSQSQIMLVCSAPPDLFLEVWSLDPDSAAVNNDRPLLRLSLPDLGIETYTWFSFSHGPFQSDVNQGVPFIKRPDARMYAVITQRNDERPTPLLCIVFHHDTILALLQNNEPASEEHPKTVRWSEWGPHGTRMFLRSQPPWGNLNTGWVYNERLVGTFATSTIADSDGEGDFSETEQILDFNVRPYMPQSAAASELGLAEGKGQLITEPTTLALPVNYRRRTVEITTSLPYYSIPVDVPDENRYVGVLIDEQHLLGLKAGNGRSRIPIGFDVFTFE